MPQLVQQKKSFGLFGCLGSRASGFWYDQYQIVYVMPEKRGSESWIAYQVRHIKTDVLNVALHQVMTAAPSKPYTDAVMQSARISGYNEMRLQARSIINALIKESNLASAGHEKPTARENRADDRPIPGGEV